MFTENRSLKPKRDIPGIAWGRDPDESLEDK